MKNNSEILHYRDILNEVIEENKYLINPNNLMDAFDFHTEIVHCFYEKATTYFTNVVIPYILRKGCNPSSLSKKTSKRADIVSYNLIDSKLVRSGFTNYTIKDILISLKGELKPKLIPYISDPLKMNLSEKVHSIFFERLNVPHKKLPASGNKKVDFSEKIKIGRLTMDYTLGDSCVCTNKVLQGTSGTDCLANTDFLSVISSFKNNCANIKYKYLAIILDFPTEELKNTTPDWLRSYNKKVKSIALFKKEAGDCLNKRIFIGRFKHLYNSGCISNISS